jgi:hypothetical protein
MSPHSRMLDATDRRTDLIAAFVEKNDRGPLTF